jgi:hypothetical protein
VIAGVFGVLAWYQSVAEAKHQAALAQYEAEATKYVRSKCRSDRCEAPRTSYDEMTCANDRFNEPSCESKARSEFSKQATLPKP